MARVIGPAAGKVTFAKVKALAKGYGFDFFRGPGYYYWQPIDVNSDMEGSSHYVYRLTETPLSAWGEMFKESAGGLGEAPRKTTARINPRTTSAARAAEILYERYGQRAEVEASNRYDRAETGATADFYDRVLTALGRRGARG